MRYAVVAEKPTVYSIGKDFKDDGGQVDARLGVQPGDYLFVLTPRPGTNLTPAPDLPTAPGHIHPDHLR